MVPLKNKISGILRTRGQRFLNLDVCTYILADGVPDHLNVNNIHVWGLQYINKADFGLFGSPGRDW